MELYIRLILYPRFFVGIALIKVFKERLFGRVWITGKETWKHAGMLENFVWSQSIMI